MKLALALAALLTAATAVPVHAVQIVYTAELAGSNEVPPNGSPATGNATVVYDSDLSTLTVSYSFAGLVSPLADGHIHCCTAPGSNVGVAVGFTDLPLGTTSGSVEGQVYDLSLPATFRESFITDFAGGVAADAEASLIGGMNAGLAYVNLHTVQFPGGEIRGQLAATTAPIPEPATAALMLAGLAVLGCAGLRRRKGADGAL